MRTRAYRFAHMVDHIDDASEPRVEFDIRVGLGRLVSPGHRDRGTDRPAITVPARRGGVGGSAPTRHVAAASVWLVHSGSPVPGRRGADVCTDREGSP